MTDSIIKLDYSSESIRWMWHVMFERPEIARTASDDTRDIAWFVALCDMLKTGALRCYVPVGDNGKPMGLAWGTDNGDGTWDFHIAFLKEYWGRCAAAAAAMVEQFRDDTKAKALVAYIPRFNDRCRAFIKRLGYVATGKTYDNGMFIRHGKSEPCDEYRLALEV